MLFIIWLALLLNSEDAATEVKQSAIESSEEVKQNSEEESASELVHKDNNEEEGRRMTRNVFERAERRQKGRGA